MPKVRLLAIAALALSCWAGPKSSPFDADLRFHAASDTHFLSLRFSSEGRSQVRFEKFGLSDGMRVFVFGRDIDGNVTETVGPYVFSGPTQSGEFVSDSVSGAEIVVELQADHEAPSTLPFEVVAVGKALESPLETSEPHEYELFEGDILIERGKKHPRQAVSITGSQYRWPGGVVPYQIDPALPNQQRIADAIAHWHSKLPGAVQFVPRTTESSAVRFTWTSSSGTCSSSVGRTGYVQPIFMGNSCSTGNIIHEIGHAVGLWHEQSREDRDANVRILWQNMQAGVSYNFSQVNSNGDDFAEYDFASIMHYPATGFSANGKPTIETIPGGIPIGQRVKLSLGDIAAVKSLYTAPAASPSVTITSNPENMPVLIDGVSYRTPRVVNWAAGSQHTVVAVNPAPASGTRHLFARWNDGASQSRTIVVAGETVGYTAHYSVNFALTASGVTVTPVSPDAFYVPYTVVALNAAAPSGSCFSSWSGLIAGTPPSTTLNIARPYTIQANFAPGSVTASSASIAAPKAASTVQIGIDAGSACYWSASSNASWAAIASAKNGTGSATMHVSLSANPSTNSRTATITLSGNAVTIVQSGT